MLEDKILSAARLRLTQVFGSEAIWLLPGFSAVETLGRPRAHGNSVLDLLMNSSPAGAWTGTSQSDAFFSNRGMPATPGAIASTAANQQQPAIPEVSFSFAELLAGGAVEVDGPALPAKPGGGTSTTNEPFRKNQRKADIREAEASPVLVPSALEGLVPPIQFGAGQACESGSGSGQSDDPTRNAGVEPDSGDAPAWTFELLGKTNERQLGLAGEPNAGWTGSAAIARETEDEPAVTSSAPETEYSDSSASARPPSNPLPPNRDLELPAAKPMGSQSDPAISLCPPEPVQAKHVAAGTPPTKTQESGSASGRISPRDVSAMESSPGRPGNRVEEPAGTAQRHAGASTIMAAPGDSGAPAETVFSLLVARGNRNADSQVADVPAEEASVAGVKLEPAGEQGPPDGPVAELPRNRQARPESESGDQDTPERFRQPGEPGGAGLSSSPAPEFSFFADGAVAEPQTEQVWSRLDAGAIQPDPHEVDPAQPLTAIELTSRGPERISVRVLESRGGLEVQVATQDTASKQDLLGGLDELASRVRELSLGTVIPGREGPDPGQDFQRGNRQHQSNREDWRPRAKKSGVAFAPPIGSVGEHIESKPVRRS